MLKENADDFIDLGERMYDATAIYGMDEHFEDAEYPGGPKRLNEAGKNALRVEMKSLLAIAKKLSLPATTMMIGRRVGFDQMPQTQGEYDVLVELLRNEIAAKLFVFIPAHRATWFSRDDILSLEGRTAFPMASQEMKDAGNAFAAGLPTASVFHAMRALEHGLRALALEVRLTFDVQQWQDIISQIESKIRGLEQNGIPGLDKAAKDAQLLFLSQAARQFAYFKNGWRNYTMHAKGPYDEQQAITIMSHVRDFLDGLSSQLGEPT